MLELTVLILTPLALEYAAVSKHLTDRHTTVREGAAYEIGHFTGQHHTYKVVLREPGMKNADMALATERAIQHFDPQIAILCGIAGGIKDVQKGDVAIARSAFNYDAGKEAENGFLPRPAEYHFSEDLLAYAQLVQRNDDWKKRCTDGAPNAQVHIASVAAGDKVVAAVENATYERITQFLSHCKFLEMEAAGFGLAVQRHRNIHALVVRGISDMCRGKGETDKMEEGWQGRAAERAAGVVMEVLWQARDLSFISSTTASTMSAQELAQKVYELIIPSLLQNAPLPKDQQAIWKQVEPLCGSALEKLKKSPDNADRQASLRIALEDGLEDDKEIKRAVEALLPKTESTISPINIVGGKNIVAGSTIKAGGNVTIGDQTVYQGQGDAVHRDKIEIHHHYTPNTQVPTPASPENENLGTAFKQQLRNHITKGRPEQALDELVAYTKSHPGSLQMEVIALSDRWKELSRKNRMHLISNDEAILERNRIVAGLLGVVG